MGSFQETSNDPYVQQSVECRKIMLQEVLFNFGFSAKPTPVVAKGSRMHPVRTSNSNKLTLIFRFHFIFTIFVITKFSNLIYSIIHYCCK